MITVTTPGGIEIALTRAEAQEFWAALGNEIARDRRAEQSTPGLFDADAAEEDAAGYAEEQTERDQLAWAEGSRHRMPWAASDLNQPKT